MQGAVVDADGILTKAEDEFLATWLLNVAVTHCDTCLGNAATYKPLSIPK